MENSEGEAMICKQCEKLGKKSTVERGHGTVTLAYMREFYDEEGNLIKSSDVNRYHTHYNCSNGHSWKEET